jgi:hypothetical protein
MEAAVGYKFAKAPRTMTALFERFVRKFLQCLLDSAALAAFILVKGHLSNLRPPFCGLSRPFLRPACVKLVKNSQQNIIVKGMIGELNLPNSNFFGLQQNAISVGKSGQKPRG